MSSLTFFYAPRCPRCRQAAAHLAALLDPADKSPPERIDVLRQPLRTWRAGVRMIPALMCNGDILSGIVLNRQDIQAFLERHNIRTGAAPDQP